MKSITSKWKIWVIATLIIVVLGMAFLGIFGLNNSLDYKDSYEVSVYVDQDISDSVQKAKTATTNYFNTNGVKPASYSQKLDKNGYIYKFSNVEGIVASDLKASIETALTGINTDVTVNVLEVVPATYSKTCSFIIAIAVAFVLGFLATLILEKWQSAVSSSLVAIASAIIFISLSAMFRIPVGTNLEIFVAFTIILSFVLSIIMANRFKEIIKLSEAKLDSKEVADKGAKASLFRYAFVCGILLVSAIVLTLLGGVSFAFIGAQILAVIVSAVLFNYALTPTLWSAINK